MFGDPVTNPMGWDVQQIEKVAPIRPYQGEVEDDDGQFWLLYLDMVEPQTGAIISKNMVSIEKINNSTIAFSEDNVLYSKLRPYLNKVVLPMVKGYATTEMLPLLPNKKKLDSVFFVELLRGTPFLTYIQDKVAGTKMPRVQMDIFRRFPVITPPLDLQHRFAEFVRAADKSKLALQNTIDELEATYKSLLRENLG